MITRRNGFGRNLVGVGLMAAFAMPLALAVEVALATVLEPEAFGLFSFALSLILVLVIPVKNGLQQLLLREVALNFHRGNWASLKGVVLSGLIWVLLYSLFIVTFFTINDDLLRAAGLPIDVVSIFLVLVPLVGVSALRNGTLKGLGYPVKAEFPTQVLEPAIFVCLLAFFSMIGTVNVLYSALFLVSASICSYFCLQSFFYRHIPSEVAFTKPEFTIDVWGKAWLAFTALSFMSVLNSQIGIIFLGFYGADDQIAGVKFAERGGQVVSISLALVNLVIAPYIVDAFRRGESEELKALALKGCRVSVYFAFPMGLVIIVFGRQVLGLLLDSEYTTLIYYPMVIVVVGQLINVLFGSVGQVLSMTGHERDTFKAQFFAALINLAGCILLIPGLGAIGAALAFSISLVIWNIVAMVFVKRRLGITVGLLRI